MSFGKRVKQRREALGWTQKELANKMDWSQHRISEVELEKRHQLPFDRIRDLARTLGVSADWLLGTWDDIEQVPEPKRKESVAP
jgi:transcriptional regulator with XRE-family HTH domain